MLPSCIIQRYINSELIVAITVIDPDGTVNTLSTCKVLTQDGDMVEFVYIKSGNDMVYVYHREDIKQIRHEIVA